MINQIKNIYYTPGYNIFILFKKKVFLQKKERNNGNTTIDTQKQCENKNV